MVRQDSPCIEYWEGLLEPGVHYISTDSNFDNLTAAIEWAREHDAEVVAMVDRAHELLHSALSVEGIYFFMQQLLLGYSELFHYTPVVNPARAKELVCSRHNHALCRYRKPDGSTVERFFD